MSNVKPENLEYYAKQVRSVVPKEAFKPAYYKLFIMFLYLTIVVALALVVKTTGSIWITILCSVVSGILLSGLFMFSHELSHNTIIKKDRIRNPLEIFFWGLNYFPATLWRKLHHHNHHVNTNTYKDPDRRPFKSDKNSVNTIFNYLTYPNKLFKYSFTVGFAMPVYTIKHIASVFYPEGKKPATVLYKPKYTSEEKRAIALELIPIVFIQVAIFLLIGSVSKYLIFTAISVYVSSSFTISLIMTQHYLRPNYIAASDPLLTTTSIQVPKFLNYISDFHSYHVEHHVIPGINFDYYPLIAEELKRKFPERYHQVPFLTAIKQAFEYEAFLDDPHI